MSIQTPRFIDALERRYHRFGIENLGFALVILQACGFLAIKLEPAVFMKFIFLPKLFLQGEFWRIFTFLAMPLTDSLLIIIALLFLYGIFQTLEQTWGAFKTTLYFLIGVIASVAYSLATGFPIASIMYLEFTLVLAVASLHPMHEIYFWGILPMRMWMLGAFFLFLVVMDFIQGSALLRGYILVVFSNYFLFFGMHNIGQIRYRLKYGRWGG